MAISFAGVRKTVSVYLAREEEAKEEMGVISPLELRLPDVGITEEMKRTGKSANTIRVERGEGNGQDHLIAFMEKKLSKAGRERG